MYSTEFSPVHQSAKVRKVLSSFSGSLSKASRRKVNSRRGTDYGKAFDLLKDSKTYTHEFVSSPSTNLLTSDESFESSKSKRSKAEAISNIENEEPIIISDDETDNIIEQSNRYFTNSNKKDDIIVISDNEDLISSRKLTKKNDNSDSFCTSLIDSSIKENIQPTLSRSAKKHNPILKKKPEEIKEKRKTPLSESKTKFIENWLQKNRNDNEDSSQTTIEKDGSDIDEFKNILLGYFSNSKSSTKKDILKKPSTNNNCRKKLNYKDNSESTKENIIANIVIDSSSDESLDLEGFQTFSSNVKKQMESTSVDLSNKNVKKKSSNYRTRKLSFSSESEEHNNVFIAPKANEKKKEKKIRSKKEKEPVPNFLDRSYLEVNILTSFSDANPNQEALFYIKNFKKQRQELTLKLFKLYNTYVFENRLPALPLDWSNRMQCSAGFCYNKREFKNNKMVRSSRIQLSTKVVDNPARLRDTLLHEMCHAASWIISEVRDGHGPIWNSWASLAGRVFPDIPPVTRCHNYTIQTKYTYRCKNCGYSFGRQSKSIDIEKKRCGKCYGVFEILVNSKKPNNVGSENTPNSGLRTPRAPSAFALFVKENYGIIKQSIPGLKHADVMKELGQKFASLKSK